MAGRSGGTSPKSHITLAPANVQFVLSLNATHVLPSTAKPMLCVGYISDNKCNVKEYFPHALSRLSPLISFLWFKKTEYEVHFDLLSPLKCAST